MVVIFVDTLATKQVSPEQLVIYTSILGSFPRIRNCPPVSCLGWRAWGLVAGGNKADRVSFTSFLNNVLSGNDGPACEGALV